jgi:CRISPR/Cas system-associated endonuclease Cas1
MHKEDKPLEKIYDWEENWGWLQQKVKYVLEIYNDETVLEPEEIHRRLTAKDWSDDLIWQALIEICDERIQHCEEQIGSLEKQKPKNRLKLQVIKKLGSIPKKDELDRLLRYEGAIERQFYRAMNQLERLQRLRSGDKVPALVEVDVNVDTGGSD